MSVFRGVSTTVVVDDLLRNVDRYSYHSEKWGRDRRDRTCTLPPPRNTSANKVMARNDPSLDQCGMCLALKEVQGTPATFTLGAMDP